MIEACAADGLRQAEAGMGVVLVVLTYPRVGVEF
jgi:hypothetical protein